MRTFLLLILLSATQLLNAQASRFDPHKNFKFRVMIESAPSELNFSEVSGLGMELEVAEYRSGDEPSRARKMPGMQKYSNITLKRGTFAHSPRMANYFKAVSAKRVKKENIKILMLDDSGKTLRTWILLNARPMKYSGAQLSAKGGNEVAMEELIIAHEGIERY